MIFCEVNIQCANSKLHGIGSISYTIGNNIDVNILDTLSMTSYCIILASPKFLF